MNMRSFSPHILLLLNTAAAAADLLATRCPTLPLENVACVNSYAAVLPLPFTRPSSLKKTYNPLDRFSDISVPDSSIQLVRDAPFTVYDEARAVKTLGPSPNLEIMFKVENVVHEAPVYVPELKAIIASQLHQNILSQIIIDLNSTPPTITGFEPSQPIYAVNGGRYFNGTVYWAVAGGSVILNSSTKIEQVPGIYTLDPITREVKPILNNYFGQRFNSPDDLVVDSTGDVFFTDPWYGSRQNLTQDAPVLHQQTYRFRPSTSAVSIVEASIGIPNGIALSPDERTLYISDTSVTNFTGVDPNVLPRYTWGATAGKSLYAFDTVDSPAGKYLVNKRPIWYPEEFAVDGLHVAGNGYLVGASGFGVDVLSQWGELLIRVQTDFIVNNVQFVEKDLWVFGQGKIARVEWNLEGLVGARS